VTHPGFVHVSKPKCEADVHPNDTKKCKNDPKNPLRPVKPVDPTDPTIKPECNDLF